MKGLKVTFIGTAPGRITAKRGQTALLVDTEVLIDCGEGTTQNLLQVGLTEGIEQVLLSHFHADHMSGLITLLWLFWGERREKRLEIFGPPGVREKINGLLNLTHTPYGDLSFEISYHPLQAGEHKEEIRVARAKHEPYTLAYRIDRDKSLVFSSDTAPTEEIIKLAEGADLLIHEASFSNEGEETAHQRFHSTPKDAAEIASKANVDALALVHWPRKYETRKKDLRKQAEPYFSGEIFVPEEMEAFSV